MFDYFTTYWLTSDGWLNNVLLTGASVRPPQDGFDVRHFWQSDEAPKTDFDVRMSGVRKLPSGAIEAVDPDGARLLFTPVTVDMVRDYPPERFGLTAEEVETIKTPGDVYLRFHAMEVPDSYEAEFGPPVAQTENSLALSFDFGEARGEDAPVGAVHFWASRETWFKKMPDGSWLHLAAGKEWADSNPELPTDTLKAHTTPDGVLSAERQRLHKTILDGVFRGKKRVRRPTAIITMGLPASGKSTLARYLAENPDELAVLDADAHRTKLPEYQAAVATKARNGAIITHSEVSNLNDTAIDLAMSEDPDHPGEYYPFLLDGVGTSTEYYRGIMREAKSKGYNVKLVMAHVRDTDQMSALDLVRIRAEDRGVRFGRFVKAAIFPMARPKLAPSFAELAPEGSSAVVIDVTDPSAPRQMMAQVGDEKIGNPNWMEEAKKAMTDKEVVALYIAATKWEAEQLAKTPITFKPGEGTEDPGTDAVPEAKRG